MAGEEVTEPLGATIFRTGLFLWSTSVALALVMTPIYYSQMQFGYRLFPQPLDGLALFGLLWAVGLFAMSPAVVLVLLVALTRRSKVIWAVATAWAGIVSLFLLIDTASLVYSGSHLIFYLSYLTDMAANPHLTGFDMVGGTGGLVRPVMSALTAALVCLGVSYAAVRKLADRPKILPIFGGAVLTTLLWLPLSQLLWSDFVASSLAYQRLPFALRSLETLVRHYRSQGVRITEISASETPEGTIVLHNFGPPINLDGWQLVTRLKSDKLSGTLAQNQDLAVSKSLALRSEWVALLDAQGREIDSLQYTPASVSVTLSLPYERPISDQLQGSTLALQTALRNSLGSSDPPAPIVGLNTSRDVVIIMAESWRRDSLTPEGAPHLTRWAEQGMLLRQHFSSSNATHLGLYSLLYGRCAITFRRDLALNLPPILPQALHDRGYETSYFCASSSNGWKWMERILTPESFDEVHFGTEKMSSPNQGWTDMDREYFQAIPKLLASREKPQLVVLHSMSTHLPYLSPPEFEVRKPCGKMDDVLQAGGSQPILKNRYFNSVLYLDSLIGEMLSQLDLENTIVIITGDHGEAIWDDGSISHATRASQVQMAVPFLMLGAGVPRGQVDKRTYHADVTPSVLHALAGHPITVPGTHGVDFLAPFTRDSVPIVPYSPYSPYSLVFFGPEAGLGFTVAATNWFAGRADLGPLDEDVTVRYASNVRADGTAGSLPPDFDYSAWNQRLAYWAEVLSQ